jgi:putative cell wall-binding protein
MRPIRGLVAALAALLTLSVLPVALPADAADGHFGVWLDSESDEVVGDGTETTATSVEHFVDEAGPGFRAGGFELRFGAPLGAPLIPGTYEGAQAGAGGVQPFLSIHRIGDPACATTAGRFIVDEVTYGEGVIDAFAARFEQHCDGAGAALFGSIAYNAAAENGRRALSTPDLEFSSYNGESTSATLTISNAGVSTLHPDAFAVDPDGAFAITANTCTALAPGDSCDVTVEFTPIEGEYFTQELLTFTDELATTSLVAGEATTGTGRSVALYGMSYPPDIGAHRVSGDNRLATAIAASADAFAEPGSADAVVLARADSFADALSGAPLAVAAHGPLLLNPTSSLHAAVEHEIKRVLPAGRTVYLLGGGKAISRAVQDRLKAIGYNAVRLRGDDRYATAARIAREVVELYDGDLQHVFFATGLSFADALGAGAAAAGVNGVVLLTRGPMPASANEAFLTGPGAGVAQHCFGGPACAAYPASTHLVGANRYATAALAAAEFFDGPLLVGVANGRSFADALAGAAHVGGLGPLLLTSSAAVPSETAAYIADQSLTIGLATVYGGTAAVKGSVMASVDQLVKAQ